VDTGQGEAFRCLVGALWVPCRRLVGALQEPCGCLAGALRVPCRSLAGCLAGALNISTLCTSKSPIVVAAVNRNSNLACQEKI